MKIEYTAPAGVVINYEKSIWTGKKNIKINREDYFKVDKRTYRTPDNKYAYISGNILAGLSIICDSGKYTILRKPTALEWCISLVSSIALVIYSFIFSANVIYSFIYSIKLESVVLGAVIGGIGGFLGMIGIYTDILIFRKFKKPLSIILSLAVIAILAGLVTAAALLMDIF